MMPLKPPKLPSKLHPPHHNSQAESSQLPQHESTNNQQLPAQQPHLHPIAVDSNHNNSVANSRSNRNPIRNLLPKSQLAGNVNNRKSRQER